MAKMPKVTVEIDIDDPARFVERIQAYHNLLAEKDRIIAALRDELAAWMNRSLDIDLATWEVEEAIDRMLRAAKNG